MRTVSAVLVVLLLAPALGGCRETRRRPAPAESPPEATQRPRGPVAPQAQSIAEIRRRTLARIAELENDAEDGTVDPVRVRTLAISLRYLAGHMKTTGVGTDAQRRALGKAHRDLRAAWHFQVIPPIDWRPDAAKVPPSPTVEAWMIGHLLGPIRKRVESVPNSEKKPDWGTPD